MQETSISDFDKSNKLRSQTPSFTLWKAVTLFSHADFFDACEFFNNLHINEQIALWCKYIPIYKSLAIWSKMHLQHIWNAFNPNTRNIKQV